MSQQVFPFRHPLMILALRRALLSFPECQVTTSGLPSRGSRSQILDSQVATGTLWHHQAMVALEPVQQTCCSPCSGRAVVLVLAWRA